MYVAVNTLSELNTGDDPTFKGPVVIDGVSKSLSVVQTCTPFGCQKWHIQFIPSNCSEENLSFSSTPRHSISHYHTSLETPLQNAIQPKNSSSNVTAYFNPWIPKLPSASIDSGKKPLCVPDVCYPGEWLTSLPSCPDGKWAETDSAVGREGHISEMTDWFHFFSKYVHLVPHSHQLCALTYLLCRNSIRYVISMVNKLLNEDRRTIRTNMPS